jgi:uncharacterized protein (TIGR00661 family)
VYKIGIGNYFTPARPDVEHPVGFRRDRFNVRVIDKLVTSGLDVRFGCHFYPIDGQCLPPILRPEVLSARVENRGHLLVYHAFPGLLAPVADYAARHPSTPIIMYGYHSRPHGLPANIHMEVDSNGFLGDLAGCAAFIGTAGFQSIAEAFFLGKKLVAQPIEGHYEQKWNAFELERRGIGRVCRDDLQAALDQDFDVDLHKELAPWYRIGAERHYERIILCGER